MFRRFEVQDLLTGGVVQVLAVGDQSHAGADVDEQCADQPRPAMVKGAHGVEQVGAETHSCLDGSLSLLVVCPAVAGGHQHPGRIKASDRFQGPR